MAKKTKFQMRLIPIDIGEMLEANAWFSVTYLITPSIVKNDRIITIVVMKE